MTAVSTIISADQAGCWLDGASGWRNTGRVIRLAIEYGWDPPDSKQEALRIASKFIAGQFDYDGLAEDASELAEAATSYLTECAPDGYSFSWEAYELTLRKDEAE